MNGGAKKRVDELLAERDRDLPVWVRCPKEGHERYSGFSRSKLYELADESEGPPKIRSVSIREPGQTKGTRLFHLGSILKYIELCEQDFIAGKPNGKARAS